MHLPNRYLIATLRIGGCAVQDSRIAETASSRLIGMSEADLQACLGSPDQHSSFCNTDVLTYYETSRSATNDAIPLTGGIGFSNCGYCHATFKLQNGTVTRLLYSGEKNATFAPDAYCAPIVRSCLEVLRQSAPTKSN